MKPRIVHLAGTGCCLMDYLYTRVDFAHPLFQLGLSRVAGDGGLKPGGLVFGEDFERYLGRPFPDWLQELTGGQPPNAENLGGPAVVALIHAAQMHFDHNARVTFHAGCGDDSTGEKIREILAKTPVESTGYKVVPGPTPTTVVLSDPGFNGGKGERSFINTMGAAGAYGPTDLDDDRDGGLAVRGPRAFPSIESCGITSTKKF